MEEAKGEERGEEFFFFLHGRNVYYYKIGTFGLSKKNTFFLVQTIARLWYMSVPFQVSPLSPPGGGGEKGNLSRKRGPLGFRWFSSLGRKDRTSELQHIFSW